MLSSVLRSPHAVCSLCLDRREGQGEVSIWRSTFTISPHHRAKPNREIGFHIKENAVPYHVKKK